VEATILRPETVLRSSAKSSPVTLQKAWFSGDERSAGLSLPPS
jgi:hypothetical protein